ncbi:polyphosphate kinase 2 family protein [Albibacterium indicum]|uniref:polyphosphate kinase 2 family protein n=1 Tax=Albibacterium indicum TaxID=2292082 RepID=UPI000E4CD536|nr:polyphosphate kinase 2 family protein [Pedobacter indicus]
MSQDYKQFKITKGPIKLADFKTDETFGLSKKDAKEDLEDFQETLFELQERLYAENRRSLLIVFQAMDAAGKDSAIEHVMSGVNPQGCQVFSFKQPNDEDYEHDFLWRHYDALPERGRIGIHNRSHYEYVLVCKVHPEYILKERLPNIRKVDDITKPFWDDRYKSIRQFEEHLTRNGTTIIKFFLHLSKEEQHERFMDRLNEKDKHWKFSAGDLDERELWEDYERVYEECISATSSDEAPWYIIPADKKWFSRLAIGRIIVKTLQEMNPDFPKVSKKQAEELKLYKEQLESEADKPK